MDVSGHILRIWMPAIHAAMTAKRTIDAPTGFDSLAGELKLMKNFLVISK
jgi:hypothetical protein